MSIKKTQTKNSLIISEPIQISFYKVNHVYPQNPVYSGTNVNIQLKVFLLLENIFIPSHHPVFFQFLILAHKAENSISRRNWFSFFPIWGWWNCVRDRKTKSKYRKEGNTKIILYKLQTYTQWKFLKNPKKKNPQTLQIY